jgi:hypothetical protein
MGKRKQETKPPPDQSGRFVVVKVPIGELSDGNEYQTSRNNPPRQLRNRKLDPHQGRALAAVLVGMMEQEERLDIPKLDFGTGHSARRPVMTKEQCISRLLELIANAIEEQA